MRGHTKTALGIDIGKRRVSVALVEKSEQGFRVLAAAGAALPMPAPQSPEPAYGRVLSRLLAQLGRRSHVRRARAALALAPDSLVMQLLDMPRHMPANFGDFVGSELQQYVALSGKRVVSDFCGIGSGVPKRLLAVAADGDEIQEVTEACTPAATGIDTVEPAALAYARAFLAREKGLLVRDDPVSTACPPSVPREVVIAVLGPHTLTTTVFRRDTLDLVRVREIPNEANTLLLLCRWLAEELKAVGRYYDMHDHHVCLAIHDNAYRADDIAPLLAIEAGTKTFTVADVYRPDIASGAAPQQIASKKVRSPTQESTLGRPVSLVAVGAALALLGAEGDELRINLLPQAVTEARSLTRHVLLTMIVGVVLFLAVFATAQLLTRTAGVMNRRIEDTRLAEELYTASALIAEEKFLDQEIARLRRQVEPLRNILKGRQETDWPDILRAVREAAPEGVLVTQLQCSDGRSASLRGLAPSCPVAEVFVRNLEAQKAFTSASLMLVQQRPNKDGRVEYRIDCVLAAKGGQSS
jgi:Tfp pilus assembly protein PilN